ncbi:hypothetical protein ACFW04_004774 [Cataglyphis niger]
MSLITDKIMRILRKCHPDKYNIENESKVNEMKKSQKKIEREKLEEIKSKAEKLLADGRCNYVGSIEYANLNKMLAICNLEIGDEVTAIHHLVESHAVILRQHILNRYQKSQMYESLRDKPQIYGLKPTYVKFETKFVDNNESLKSKLSELPKEWYMIQVTAQYESSNVLRHEKYTSTVMHAIHITILPTGPFDIEPLCITLPRPATEVSYDICKEIKKLLSNNTYELRATYANPKQYWMMRADQNNKMKTAINALENMWLREWRILFMADPIENLEIVDELYQMLDKLISDFKPFIEISKRCRWLLRKILTCSCFLTHEEIARAVKFLLPDYEKLANNIILSIYGKLVYVQKLENAKRKTLVLIIDEHMDYIAFEAMEIIKNHPVTRFPSLHVAYALFKEHEDTIIEGCKIIKAKEDMGICMVNPSGNLNKMEKRIKLFMDFWLPEWKTYNTEPSEEIFEDALINHDILMYTGHGSGIEYLPGENIERMRVRSTVLLFGCSSVKLFMIGGRYPPFGISNQYLIACSPCLLGMLWEVTDFDIDKMTAHFMSNWVPSISERSWADVDIDNWNSGTLKFTKKTEKDKMETESEMLRAVAKSKNKCSHYMTAAAIIVRGLPMKII